MQLKQKFTCKLIHFHNPQTCGLKVFQRSQSDDKKYWLQYNQGNKIDSEAIKIDDSPSETWCIFYVTKIFFYLRKLTKWITYFLPLEQHGFPWRHLGETVIFLNTDVCSCPLLFSDNLRHTGFKMAPCILSYVIYFFTADWDLLV